MLTAGRTAGTGAIRVGRQARAVFLLATGIIVGLSLFVGRASALPFVGTAGAIENASDALVAVGEAFFLHEFTPDQGLGPLFNASSCLACHSSPAPGGAGPEGLGAALRVGRLTESGVDPLDGRGGPVARAHSVAELGFECGLKPGIPPGANLTSVRIAPVLFGLGLIDQIPDDLIRAGAIDKGDGVHGRPNIVLDAAGRERVGRFGWKADTATLEQFVADAYRNELGITSPLAHADVTPARVEPSEPCAGDGGAPEDDGTIVRATTAYIQSLVAPVRRPGGSEPGGEHLFHTLGCVACHTPHMRVRGRAIPLYSDLLLHDLGPALDDGVTQGQASGRDWRTTPLWGLGDRVRYLHDGRARTLTAAIQAHAGEAAHAARQFGQLTQPQRRAILAFLESL